MPNEREWLAIPRISRTIPFGYKQDEEDLDLLQPIPFELEALEKAKKHLRNYSYRDVAEWLSDITGRYISHMGLKKRIDNDRTRQRKASALKFWAARFEKAAKKAAEIEEGRLGANSGDDGAASAS